MNTWMSWSSGKDSAFALHKLRTESDCVVTGIFTTVTEDFQRVSMHAVREELLERQAEALGLPLHRVKIPAQCTNEVYEQRMSEAVTHAKSTGVSRMGFGDLFLEDLRQYREKKLQGTGIEAVFPLWRMPTADLTLEMIRSGIKAVLTCVDPKVLPASFAGREFNLALLRDLPAGADPCGENGEFHTFVYDGPMFKKSIPVKVGERVERDGFSFADIVLV